MAKRHLDAEYGFEWVRRKMSSEGLSSVPRKRLVPVNAVTWNEPESKCLTDYGLAFERASSFSLNFLIFGPTTALQYGWLGLFLK